jgi:hypothetical protein
MSMEPRWNDIDSGKYLIRPPELSGNSIRSHLVAKQEEYGEETIAEFCLRSIPFILVGFFYTPQIYEMGPMTLLPIRRKSCYGFLSLLKIPSSSAGFESANLGSNGNHPTTIQLKVTSIVFFSSYKSISSGFKPRTNFSGLWSSFL